MNSSQGCVEKRDGQVTEALKQAMSECDRADKIAQDIGLRLAPVLRMAPSTLDKQEKTPEAARCTVAQDIVKVTEQVRSMRFYLEDLIDRLEI